MTTEGVDPLLVVDGIHVSYGRMAALKGVSINVRLGELVCLIGPNGAGKSTTLAAIAGGVQPQHGSVRFDGIDLTRKPAEFIARTGLSLIPEGRHVFSTLSVDENLRIGTYSRRSGATGDVEEMLNLFPRLRERRSSAAGKLSGGEQQMLVIARALLTKPRLLLVDEPSLGLAPKIVDQVYEILLSMRRERGLTLIINEQSSQRVLKHADRIYVIREGLVRLEGSAVSLREGEAIKKAYFGFDRHAHSPVEGVA